MVVMPFVALWVPLGRLKSTVPPAFCVMARDQRHGYFPVAEVKVITDAPGFTVRPLNCWLFFVFAFCVRFRSAAAKGKHRRVGTAVN